MNYRQLSRIYKTLSDPEKEFIREKTFEATYTIKQWMILLQKIAAYDEGNDRIRQKMGKSMIITGGVTFLSLFFFWPIALIGLLVLLWMGFRWRRLTANDLTNHLRLFLIPLLKVLPDKAGIKAPLQLKIDFRPSKMQELVDKTQFQNRTIKQFKPQYLSGAVTLKDSTQLEFHLLDDLKRLNIKKRNARGKIKYKNKIKCTHFLLIKLTLMKAYYSLKNETAPDIMVDQDHKKLVLKTKIKVKSTEADKVLPFEDFLKLLEKLYACVEVTGTLPEAVQEESDQQPTETQLKTGLEIPDAAAFAAGSFFLWSAYEFSDYDYDSFDYESTPVFGDELESDSLYDS
ncbi:MAG: hypothetical protein ACNS62_04615 [Candidatus Cyclobacteriaceae bacterium M3_2C_046]